MAGEARFWREMAATRGLHGDPAEARRDSPDPGRRHDGRLHLAATVPRRAAGRGRSHSVYDTTVYVVRSHYSVRHYSVHYSVRTSSQYSTTRTVYYTRNA